MNAVANQKATHLSCWFGRDLARIGQSTNSVSKSFECLSSSEAVIMKLTLLQQESPIKQGISPILREKPSESGVIEGIETGMIGLAKLPKRIESCEV
ncbi:hypothetical protein L195_g051682 [Trifolium pratense]|uniref:Uncharacterized protein n=1 Tax=Trifolium pratense TaxID=57577 RepID=A0A2K3K125_TRIPR|nr:hypothetical protein L195_g051682 [Trifolium pratense]